MTERILDFSSEGARLSVQNGLLLVERHKQPKVTVPFEEVAVLIGAHRELLFTQAVFSRLAENGGIFVACDGRGLPVGLMLPLAGHHMQTARFAAQAQASKAAQKRQWQGIVRAKILAQGALLNKRYANDRGLTAMAARVQSGDPVNLEGQAARRYWGGLFADDPKFRRDRDLPGRNALLNYGYAVLRGIAARAICGAGLHPSFGLHHHNRYDAYALAADLMEPFRPIVDEAVARITENNPFQDLDPPTKRHLLSALLEPVSFQKEQRSLFDALARMAASLAQVYMGERRDMLLPGDG